MEITQETDYAVRCVLYLSSIGPEQTVRIEEIAAEMQIPRSFLAKILQKLTQADVVRSYRGVKGGFRLSRPPKEITLLQVVEAVEGPVTMNRCTREGSLCDFKKTCAVHPVWRRLRTIVETYMKDITFEKLKKERRQEAMTHTILTVRRKKT
ncbi:MAG: RrF2 family transcriptional regulator [Thermodesulfovibrionales bacterium]